MIAEKHQTATETTELTPVNPNKWWQTPHPPTPTIEWSALAVAKIAAPIFAAKGCSFEEAVTLAMTLIQTANVRTSEDNFKSGQRYYTALHIKTLDRNERVNAETLGKITVRQMLEPLTEDLIQRLKCVIGKHRPSANLESVGITTKSKNQTKIKTLFGRTSVKSFDNFISDLEFLKIINRKTFRPWKGTETKTEKYYNDILNHQVDELEVCDLIIKVAEQRKVAALEASSAAMEKRTGKKRTRANGQPTQKVTAATVQLTAKNTVTTRQPRATQKRLGVMVTDK
jgi:hypothetical protein